MAGNNGSTIIHTPIWILVARIFQILLAVIVVGSSAWWIHGYYMDSLGFAIVCGLFTWIIALYAVLSEKVAGCRSGYNTWAVLSLDGLMIVFWLSAMGAVASARASFKYNVNVESCVNDGTTVNSNHCTISKRAGVATYEALDVLSGIAGICALTMLLFVASFAYICHFFRLSYANSRTNNPEKFQAGTEMMPNMPGQQQQQQHMQYTVVQQPIQPQHTGFSQHAPTIHQVPSQVYMQYPQSSPGPGGVYSPGQVGQQPHQYPSEGV